MQIQNPKSLEENKARKLDLYTQDEISFTKFIELLLPPSPDLEGCEVQFPDSVFMGDEGKPIFIAKTDKEGKLVSITQSNKLGLTEIRQKFAVIVRERKQETKNFFQHLMQKEGMIKQDESEKANGSQTPSNKKQNLLTNMNKKLQQLNATSVQQEQEVGGSSIQDRKKNNTYEDTALFRYRKDEEGIDGVLVYKDSGFMKILEKRQNNDQWKKVEVIQTCIKARIGCGEPVFVHFFAPIDEANPGAEIEYDYQSMPTDADLVLNKEDQIYAYKQCLKFCYYISKVRGIEILQMKAEFLKDENQFIWFYYAHNIYCRKNQNKNTMNSEDAKKQAIKLQQSKERQRQKMVKELEDYEQQQRS